MAAELRLENFRVPAMTAAREPSQGLQAATPVCFALGAATMIAHTFTGAGFGFHGDELQFMDDARYLAWGYVAYPPMTPFFARLSLDLFGTSLAGFRFFASLAQAVAYPDGADGVRNGRRRARSGTRGRLHGIQLLR
jgi:hypothetical protein